jgi:hypothetical protein
MAKESADRKDVPAAADAPEGSAEKPDTTGQTSDNANKPIVPAANPESVLEDESPLLRGDETDRAVDDIMAHEGDEVLAAEDNERAAAAPRPKQKGGFWRGVGLLFRLWLGTSRGRWITFVLLVAACTVVGVTPKYRYYALNKAGVQAGASLTVVDDLTQLPLKNVQVTIEGQSRQTNTDGTVTFQKLRLGPSEVHIDQPGFSTVQHTVVLGWGSNPLGPFPLQAVGARYAIDITDWLTGKPLAGVQATSGDATALSDRNGRVELTLENAADAANPVTLTREGYRTEQVSLKSTKEAAAAHLVLAQKIVYVDSSGGQADLYASDLDGANKSLVLAGTGQENGAIAVAESPDHKHAAIIDTRDGKQDSDGFLENTLTLVDLTSKTTTTLAQAGQIQLIDWSGTHLIFEQVSSDPATPAASKTTVVNFDYAANSRLQLAAAPRLSNVLSAQGDIYYAVAASDDSGAPKAGLYRVNADGSGRQTIIDQEVQNVVRTDYNTLHLQTAAGWTAYTMLGNGAKSSSATPADLTSRHYIDNADHTQSLWVNQGALTIYDVATGKDTVLQKQDGLAYPVQWLDGAVLYRVSTDTETAMYITALSGGQAHKVADVSPTTGFATGQ